MGYERDTDDDLDEGRFRHGMFQQTSNFDREEKLLVWESAEDYVLELGGHEDLPKSKIWDCYQLALTEFRIARAEGIMYENVEEFLDNETPERNLDRLVERRQTLRKDLGLLEDSPEAKEADASESFFKAVSTEAGVRDDTDTETDS